MLKNNNVKKFYQDDLVKTEILKYQTSAYE